MKVTALFLVLACAMMGDAIPMLVPSVEESLVVREFDGAQNATDQEFSEQNSTYVDFYGQNATDVDLYGQNATDVDIYGQNYTEANHMDHMNHTWIEEYYGQCLWRYTATTFPDYWMCMDGHFCNGAFEGYDCCNVHGGRALCPANFPVMCKAKQCAITVDDDGFASGGDFCCEASLYYCKALYGEEPYCENDLEYARYCHHDAFVDGNCGDENSGSGNWDSGDENSGSGDSSSA